MKNSENLEGKKVNLSNNKKNKIQEKSAGDLGKCLREPNIKYITEWIDDTLQGTAFSALHPNLAKKLKESKDINEYKSNLGYTISSILFNTDAILGYLNNVELGKPTGDIEYHLKLVKEGLEKLKKEKCEDPVYEGFILMESDHFKKIESYAKNTIGKRKRGENGIYE